MCVVQAIARDRNELALVVCCATRLGIPFHSSGPKHIFLAMPHTVDVAFQLFICVERRLLGKVLIAEVLAETVSPAPFRLGRFAKQTFEDTSLQSLRFGLIKVEFVKARSEDGAYDISQRHVYCLLFRRATFGRA